MNTQNTQHGGVLRDAMEHQRSRVVYPGERMGRDGLSGAVERSLQHHGGDVLPWKREREHDRRK